MKVTSPSPSTKFIEFEKTSCVLEWNAVGCVFMMFGNFDIVRSNKIYEYSFLDTNLLP